MTGDADQKSRARASSCNESYGPGRYLGHPKILQRQYSTRKYRWDERKQQLSTKKGNIWPCQSLPSFSDCGRNSARSDLHFRIFSRHLATFKVQLNISVFRLPIIQKNRSRNSFAVRYGRQQKRWKRENAVQFATRTSCFGLSKSIWRCPLLL